MTANGAKSASRPVRALVIGAGPAAVAIHLPVLAGLRDKGDVVLCLICDIDRERAAAARRTFEFLQDSGEGLDALERSDIDAVYIFGSAQLHYEYGMAALRNGKHLFVEKPIAPSYTQAAMLAQTARTRGLIAAAGHNRRFYKSLAEVRARAGKVGWRFAEAVFHKPEYGKPVPFGARTWLGANGIHGLDALVFMMNGLPEYITALTGDRGAEPSAFSAVMRWPDGSQGTFLCNNNAGSRREEYVFHGIGETYSVTGDKLMVEKGASVQDLPIVSLGDGYTAEHECFLRSIRSGTEPPHSISAIAPSLFLSELVEGGFSGPVRLPRAPACSSPASRASAREAILITQPAGLLPALANSLPGYRLVSLQELTDSAEARPDIVAAILGRGSRALPPELLQKLPRLSIVGIVGLSLMNHAPEALLTRGVTVVNASTAYAESAAEFAFGLAILARRRAFVSHQVMRERGWGTALPEAGLRGLLKRLATRMRPAVRGVGLEPLSLRLWRAAQPVIPGSAGNATAARTLQGSTVGMIGWGSIARAFTEHLLRAQARVLVYSEHAMEQEINQSGATAVALSEALAADIVSLHRGLTEHTRHFLGAAELAKLRPGTILLNVARGALIEPKALLARVRKGDIFACLDTYENEPLPASDPLRQLPNVFLTSHIAGGSKDMHQAAIEEVVRKVALHLQGNKVESISAERLGTMT